MFLPSNESALSLAFDRASCTLSVRDFQASEKKQETGNEFHRRLTVIIKQKNIHRTGCITPYHLDLTYPQYFHNGSEIRHHCISQI